MHLRRFIGVIACLVLAACGGDATTAPTVSSNPPLAEFDALWAKYDATYPYFAYKNVNWDSLRTVYRPRAANAATQPELIDVLVEMLGNLRDGHAYITDRQGHFKSTYPPAKFVNWQQPVWYPYAQRYGVQFKSTYLAYATISTVPYILIATWLDSQISTAAVDSIIDLFPNAPAFIIDVRYNGGGDTLPAFHVAERFYDVPRIAEYTRHRNGPSHSDLEPAVPVRLNPRGSKPITAPVLVLAGRGSISAAEDFVSAMQALPNVTIAGDTTAGMAGYPVAASLAYGWGYEVPSAMVLTASMQVIEWNGIAPSVYIRTTPADFAAGVDPVFEYAIQWATAHSAPALARGSTGIR